MKKQFLNLGKALNKAEQKSINGGYASEFCLISITNFGGGGSSGTVEMSVSDGSGASQIANDYCLDRLQGGATRCTYDCSYDGIGQ